MKIDARRLLNYLIKLLVSGAAIAYIVWKVPFADLGKILAGTNIFWFILALALYLFSQFVSTFRLGAILKARRIKIDLITNFKLYLVGMSYNLFLPGGIGGDGYKVLWISRRYLRTKKKVATCVLLDRLSGLMMIVIIGLLVVPHILIPGLNPILPLLLIPVIYLSSYLGVKKFFPKYLRVFHIASGWSFAVQTIQIVVIVLLSISIHSGIETTTLIFIFLASSVATAIPVFLGGMGARELVFAGLAIELGANEQYAISVALLFSLITVLSSLPGLFLDWHLNPAKEKVAS